MKRAAKREPRPMVEITYEFRGETYLRADDRSEALERIESITSAGGKIVKIESFNA